MKKASLPWEDKDNLALFTTKHLKGDFQERFDGEVLEGVGIKDKFLRILSKAC